MAVLKRARLFDAVMTSLYTYDCNSYIVQAFCEVWCPSMNTIHISAGEMSILLWDLW
uniref:Aminotransferase-like plant mobile domain-containing protein n=1 Tax=Cucumis melo TaxID=3656 RepID=A0A9I9DJU0_CUCME